MKPVVVKYRERSQLYNVEDNYSVSSLLLDVCVDFDVSPAGVEFSTIYGTKLPETGVLADIYNFKKSKLIFVLVDDVQNLKDFYNVDEDTMDDSARITISLPSGETITKHLTDKDTIASLVGDLILKDFIDLNIDVSLRKRESQKRNRPSSSAQSIEMKQRNEFVAKDFSISKGDNLCIVDRKAAEQNEKLSHVDVTLDLGDVHVKRKWSFNSGDTISEALGSLLSSAHLGTKFSLNFKSENGDDANEATICLDDEDSSSVGSKVTSTFSSVYEKKRSFVKQFQVQNGDKLFLSSTPTLIGGAPVEDDEFEVQDMFRVDCFGQVDGKWNSWCMAVSGTDGLSDLYEAFVKKGCKNVQRLFVDGRKVSNLPPSTSEAKTLIADLGVQRNSLIMVKTSSCNSIAVKMIREDCTSNEKEEKTLILPIDTTGDILRKKAFHLFKCIDSSFQRTPCILYQFGRRRPPCLAQTSIDLQVWSPDGNERWVEFETLKCNPTGSSSSGDVSDANSETLMRLINEDDKFLATEESVPIIHVVPNVCYYYLNSYLSRLTKIPIGRNPWRELKYSMHLKGILIRDSTQTQPDVFLYSCDDVYFEKGTSRQYTRNQLLKSEGISIPVKNRKIAVVYLFIEDNAHRQAFQVSAESMQLWSRNGLQRRSHNERIFCIGKLRDQSFQWSTRSFGFLDFEYWTPDS